MQYPPNNQSGQEYPSQQPEQFYQPQQPPYYQPQQPPPPKKKSRRGLWIALGVVAVVLLAICIGVSALVTSAAKTVQTSVNTTLTSVATDAATNAPTTSQHHKVGEVVIVGSTWQVTLTSIKLDHTGDQFSPPKSGDVFVVIHAIVQNISDQSASISSLGNFTFRDTNGNTYTEEIGMSDKYTSPDGTVNAHEKVQGDLVYQVPTATKSYNMYFQESMISGNPSEWDIHIQ